MQWISALRPLCGTLTALLVIFGFFYAQQPIDWSVVIAVFFTTSMAMLINDYHDRENDVAKGRLLASRQPNWFLYYTLTFALISLGLSLVSWSHNPYFGILCMSMWITSIGYSKIQRNPLAKNGVVSLNVGATVLFPLLRGSKIFELWIMAISIFLIISIREYMKDVEDIEIDRGKKRTLALVMNSRMEKNLATRLKHLMTLLILALMVGYASKR